MCACVCCVVCDAGAQRLHVTLATCQCDLHEMCYGPQATPDLQGSPRHRISKDPHHLQSQPTDFTISSMSMAGMWCNWLRLQPDPR